MPIVIGDQDPGACDTIGKVYDHNQRTLAEGSIRFFIGGVTKSYSLVMGSSIPSCSSLPIPFIHWYEPPSTTLLASRYFTESVHSGSAIGYFSDIVSIRFAERQNQDSYVMNIYYMVILEATMSDNQVVTLLCNVKVDLNQQIYQAVTLPFTTSYFLTQFFLNGDKTDLQVYGALLVPDWKRNQIDFMGYYQFENSGNQLKKIDLDSGTSDYVITVIKYAQVSKLAGGFYWYAQSNFQPLLILEEQGQVTRLKLLRNQISENYLVDALIYFRAGKKYVGVMHPRTSDFQQKQSYFYLTLFQVYEYQSSPTTCDSFMFFDVKITATPGHYLSFQGIQVAGHHIVYHALLSSQPGSNKIANTDNSFVHYSIPNIVCTPSDTTWKDMYGNALPADYNSLLATPYLQIGQYGSVCAASDQTLQEATCELNLYRFTKESDQIDGCYATYLVTTKSHYATGVDALQNMQPKASFTTGNSGSYYMVVQTSWGSSWGQMVFAGLSWYSVMHPAGLSMGSTIQTQSLTQETRQNCVSSYPIAITAATNSLPIGVNSVKVPVSSTLSFVSMPRLNDYSSPNHCPIAVKVWLEGSSTFSILHLDPATSLFQLPCDRSTNDVLSFQFWYDTNFDQPEIQGQAPLTGKGAQSQIELVVNVGQFYNYPSCGVVCLVDTRGQCANQPCELVRGMLYWDGATCFLGLNNLQFSTDFSKAGISCPARECQANEALSSVEIPNLYLPTHRVSTTSLSPYLNNSANLNLEQSLQVLDGQTYKEATSVLNLTYYIQNGELTMQYDTELQSQQLYLQAFSSDCYNEDADFHLSGRTEVTDVPLVAMPFQVSWYTCQFVSSPSVLNFTFSAGQRVVYPTSYFERQLRQHINFFNCSLAYSFASHAKVVIANHFVHVATDEPGTISYTVDATVDSGQTLSLPVNLLVQGNQELLDKIPKLKPNSIRFDGEVATELSVQEVINEQGLSEYNNTFEYRSPQVVDYEQAFTVRVDGLEGLAFASWKQNHDDTVSIHLIRSLLDETAVGTYPFSISIQNEGFVGWTQFQITLNIQYQKLQPSTSGQDTNSEDTDSSSYDSNPSVQHLKADKYLENNRGKPNYTFPGVVINQNQTEEKGKHEWPDPAISIGQMSDEGAMQMNFNQIMLAPPKPLGLFYSSVFRVWFESVVDGSEIEGRLVVGAPRRVLNETGQLSEESSNSTFTYEVTEHTPLHIQLQFHFSNLSNISNSGFGYDSIKVQILEPEIFKSAMTMKSLNTEATGRIVKEVPPQISPKVKALIETPVVIAQNSITIGASSNVILSILLGYSMQQLWGAVRALQAITLLAIIEIPMPGQAQTFFQGCLSFAQMDIFSGEELFDSLFEFSESPALNDNFDYYGIGTKNYLLNSGSYFVMQGLLVLFIASKQVINKVAVNNSTSHQARQIGMWAYQPHCTILLVSSTLKLFLEGYLELCICTMLGLLELHSVTDMGEYHSLVGNSLNTFLTLSTLVALFLGPFMFVKKLSELSKDVQEPLFWQKYGFLVEGVRVRNDLGLLYNVMFMARRLLTALILIAFCKYPFFQINLVLALSLAYCCYLISYKPLDDPFQFKVELFNELCLGLSIHLIKLFLNAELTLQARDILAWCLVAIATANIMFSIGLLIQDTFLSAIRDAKHQRDRNQRVKRLEHHLTTRANLSIDMNLDDGELKQLRQQKNVYEVVQFCREWTQHRNWLRSNNIPLQVFEQEKRFQRDVKRFQLQERATDFNLTRQHLAESAELAVQAKTSSRKSKIKSTKLATIIETEKDELISSQDLTLIKASKAKQSMFLPSFKPRVKLFHFDWDRQNQILLDISQNDDVAPQLQLAAQKELDFPEFQKTYEQEVKLDFLIFNGKEGDGTQARSICEQRQLTNGDTRKATESVLECLIPCKPIQSLVNKPSCSNSITNLMACLQFNLAHSSLEVPIDLTNLRAAIPDKVLAKNHPLSLYKYLVSQLELPLNAFCFEMKSRIACKNGHRLVFKQARCVLNLETDKLARNGLNSELQWMKQVLPDCSDCLQHCGQHIQFKSISRQIVNPPCVLVLHMRSAKLNGSDTRIPAILDLKPSISDSELKNCIYTLAGVIFAKRHKKRWTYSACVRKERTGKWFDYATRTWVRQAEVTSNHLGREARMLFYQRS